ncbi:hypothetical protein [uncultured Formosa sp.]|uniref:hypothetical protein n=1 Tax=uncultured Formosa sp. TaxID=255435 RepID=UPI0026023445|nr:hypothetical protein [uncultured Formosa sp.]
MKLVGLHALSHIENEDHDLHCVVCQHTTTQNLAPALTPDSQNYNLEVPVFFVKKELSKNYCFSISNTLDTHQLFSRPPPYSI